MKKAAVGAASFIMALLIASCATGKAMDAEGKRVTVPDSQQNTGMEAVENGNTASISFDANASTGFSWDYLFDEDGVVEETSREYVAKKHPQGAVGYGGRQLYVFKALKEGRTTATFIYRRPWDADSTIFTVNVCIAVDREGNITITEIR